MDSINIILNPDKFDSTRECTFIKWDNLMPLVNKLIQLKESEEVVGYKIDDKGILVKLLSDKCTTDTLSK